MSHCVHVGGYTFVLVKEIKAMENSRSQMWCEVPFHLPDDMEVIWRFAEEVRLAYGEPFIVIEIPLKE